ncbi:MAG TPA: DUF2242 domain-containing protein, partial [Acidobacteria bacterium]|nr:DUF2242 domain-containing protein [Acidobacteriota bacterium]
PWAPAPTAAPPRPAAPWPLPRHGPRSRSRPIGRPLHCADRGSR